MNTRKIADALAPSIPRNVRLQGRLGERLAAAIDHNVMARDTGPLAQPFRDKSDEKDNGWRCEYWGKWATSAALAVAYAPTKKNLAALNKAVAELLAARESDGYIGTRKPEGRLAGWDVWGRKYVLLGLLAAYDVTGDRAVLDAARRHADTLLAECGPDKANIAAVGYAMWKGLPPSSVLEPIVLLYRRTGEEKYLAFAEHIVSRWNVPNHWSPNGLRLVDDAVAGKAPAEIGGAPKAYEMMSCYEGLCELYRAGGEKKYLDAAVKLADGVFRDELTIIGTGTAGEIWNGGRLKQNVGEAFGMETCVTVTWMKFCFQLLRLTGDPKYADALETSLYNALLGALTPEGHWWAYLISLTGDRTPSHYQHAEIGASCCAMNGPRALLLTPAWALMTDSEGPVVNLYCPGEATTRLPSGAPIRVVQETDYPVGDRVTLKLCLKKSETFALSLRIPAWSERAVMLINGENAEAETAPGTYARVRREWADGDIVELQLDCRGRAVADPGGENVIAVTRGPIVLTLDRRFFSEEQATALELVRDADGFVTLIPNRGAAEKHALWMAFDAPFAEKNGAPRALTLCDFASAGNTWDERSTYRVWLERPLDLSAAWNGTPSPWWRSFRTTRPEMPPTERSPAPLFRAPS